jgi:hypothetical protein
MTTTRYKDYIIDEERESSTGKPYFTIWDSKGIIWQHTTQTFEEAIKYIDSIKK